MPRAGFSLRESLAAFANGMHSVLSASPFLLVLYSQSSAPRSGWLPWMLQTTVRPAYRDGLSNDNPVVVDVVVVVAVSLNTRDDSFDGIAFARAILAEERSRARASRAPGIITSQNLIFVLSTVREKSSSSSPVLSTLYAIIDSYYSFR